MAYATPAITNHLGVLHTSLIILKSVNQKYENSMLCSVNFKEKIKYILPVWQVL